MNSNSLHTRRFRRIHLSVLRYRLINNDFAIPKSYRGFRERAPFVKVPFGLESGNIKGRGGETKLTLSRELYSQLYLLLFDIEVLLSAV